MSDITFVTAYNIIYDNEKDNVDLERGIIWRIKHFIKLAELGINICVYGDEITTPYIEKIIQNYRTIKLFTMNYKDTNIYKFCNTCNLNLPTNRSLNKDTKEYMTLMNCKIEYVYDAINKNPFNTKNFAWIDFSMPYILNETVNTLNYLKTMSQNVFVKKFIHFPGWWDKTNNEFIQSKILNKVNWRFCGTFFAGDKTSLLHFYNLYQSLFPIFINTYKTIVWEVNFWSWLETVCNFNFGWYYCNDNYDGIIKLPKQIFETKIVVKKTNCDGIGNVLKCFITALSISDYCEIECNADYIFGNYETVLCESQVFNNLNKIYNIVNTEFVYTCRLLVLKEEENEQNNIFNEFQYTNGIGNDNLNHYFSFLKLIDWNYDKNKIIPKIRQRIFNAIDKIKFQPIIIDNVNKILKNNYISSNNTLAISIRTWKSFHENNINRDYSFDVYMNNIINVVNNQNITKIIVSIDNIDYINEYINLFNSLNISYTILENELDNNLNELQKTVIKMLTLSNCNFLIGNRISTFTELIFWFSKCNINILPVF